MQQQQEVRWEPEANQGCSVALKSVTVRNGSAELCCSSRPGWGCGRSGTAPHPCCRPLQHPRAGRRLRYPVSAPGEGWNKEQTPLV